jgi:hypothetical protein
MATETRTEQPQTDNQAQMRTAEGPKAAPYSRIELGDMRPRGDETKPSFKSSELYIYLAAVAAVLIASQAVGTNDNHSDYFRADKAWWFIALLTIGYLVSRGLAKAGSSTRNRDDGSKRM